MKALSMPKLESQAAQRATRLQTESEKALTVKVNNIFMWTDSTTVM